jgi:hypothetical protein
MRAAHRGRGHEQGAHHDHLHPQKHRHRSRRCGDRHHVGTALLALGAATAQATPDISARGPAGTIADLPTPRECGSCEGFNPRQDPHGDPDPGSKVGLGGPDTKVGVGTPGGAPSSSWNPGDTVGIVIIGG